MGVSQMQGLRKICAIVALVGLVTVWGYAQAVNATLLGTITDSTGGVIPKLQAARYVVTDATPSFGKCVSCDDV